MRIIPVIDILNGNVVRGMQGERNKYVPIKSSICSDADPINVAKVFKSKFNFNELYIADLDSIMNGKKKFDYLNEIVTTTKMQVMIDAGTTTINDARLLLENGASKVIIATETLTNFQQLKDIINEFGPTKIITSIDFLEGKIMSKGQEIKNLSAIEIAFGIKKIGVTESIILELTRVGSSKGVSLKYISDIIKETNLKIITGGGVKSPQDLIELSKFNISGLLIATAFHDGSITPDDIKQFHEAR